MENIFRITFLPRKNTNASTTMASLNLRENRNCNSPVNKTICRSYAGSYDRTKHTNSAATVHVTASGNHQNQSVAFVVSAERYSRIERVFVALVFLSRNCGLHTPHRSTMRSNFASFFEKPNKKHDRNFLRLILKGLNVNLHVIFSSQWYSISNVKTVKSHTPKFIFKSTVRYNTTRLRS